MTFGEGVLLVELRWFDQEFWEVASIALQFSMLKKSLLEAVDGGSGRPSAKFEEIGQLILVIGLNNAPEPLDNFMILSILSFVLSIDLPILMVNIWHSINQHFQLIWLEHSQKIHGDHLVQPFP